MRIIIEKSGIGATSTFTGSRNRKMKMAMRRLGGVAEEKTADGAAEE